jgi:xanthine dehydrogenase YagS FAD-binding subunit
VIRFPTSLDEAAHALAGGGEIRAGGSELLDRKRLGLPVGEPVDLRDVAGLDDIRWRDGSLQLGALVRVRAVAESTEVRGAYPALAAAAGTLATPQIRAVATLGGNLLQRPRCPYYQGASPHCLRTGGTICGARTGDPARLSSFALGPCLAPHPSTLATALLAHAATVTVQGGEERPIEALLGDGSDPARQHRLAAGEILTSVVLPPPRAEERAAYVRVTSREHAPEWPLVEVLARLGFEGPRLRSARIAAGGVAPVPLRLRSVEAALEGTSGDAETLAAAASLAGEGADPLPGASFRIDLLAGATLEALERARADGGATAGSGARDPAGGDHQQNG